MRATVPAGATTGPIHLAAENGIATSAASFGIPDGDLPTITAFSPGRGGPGTPVVITGMDFLGARWVRFNGVPEGATTGPIWVMTSRGYDVSFGDFLVDAP